MLKSIIDFSIALIGALLFLPFFPIVCLIIKLCSHGAVFLRQDRIGKDNKLIHLYRFRVPNGVNDPAQSDLPNKKLVQNNRLLTFLRFFKVDGWPLLINVLKGDLSLVGPSPQKPDFVKHYTEKQREVIKVRPGIVGPYYSFERNGKNGTSRDHINWDEHYRQHILPEMLKVELQYVQNRSIGRDIRVVLEVLSKKITNAINDHLLKEAKSRNFFLPLDLILILISYFLSYQLRFDWKVPSQEYLIFFKSLPLIIIFRIFTFYRYRIYKNLWKYVGLRELISIVVSCTISSLLIVSAIYLLGISAHSRSIFLIDWLLCISLIGGSRVILRLFSENLSIESKLRKNLLIIGAGDVGEMLLRELDKNCRDKYNVVGFIDDDKLKHGKSIHGVKVLGACKDIPEIVPLLRVDEVLITVAQISSNAMKLILNYCKKADVKHQVVPAVSDLLSGSVHLSRFRQVDISDLFGRQPVELDLTAIRNFLCGKRVLVTGSGGSIGSELCRQIADYKPACMVLVDKNENYLHEIMCELSTKSAEFELVSSLSEITNKRKQHKLFAQYKPDTIFHAAAQKHVPLSEGNSDEAILNNIQGTKIMADLADKFGVTNFLMVSTDKAVNPTSIMGVTKRIAELYIQALSTQSKTKFVTVRFGNVLNSNGSVVPIFMRQIEHGGPVTVTHPAMERFFMSLSEAVQLILQAVTMGRSGEIFVLDMGKSIRIVDLATELITHSGLRPYKDIDIKFTGLRPGEKLFEELIGRGEELLPTIHNSIKTLRSNHVWNFETIEIEIVELLKASHRLNFGELTDKLSQLVPEYEPNSFPASAAESLNNLENQTIVVPEVPL